MRLIVPIMISLQEYSVPIIPKISIEVLKMEQIAITMENISKNIRDLLRARGMTQNTLADLTNIPKSTLARILHEDSDPSFDQILRIVKALGGSLDKLCGITNDIPADKNAEIADTAINAYTELIAVKDKQIADKDKLIATLYDKLTLNDRVISVLTRQVEALQEKQ